MYIVNHFISSYMCPGHWHHGFGLASNQHLSLAQSDNKDFKVAYCKQYFIMLHLFMLLFTQ